jgi:hypothetical protein
VAAKIGCSAERDAGTREGVTSDERERLKTLEKENRELKRARRQKNGSGSAVRRSEALRHGQVQRLTPKRS